MPWCLTPNFWKCQKMRGVLFCVIKCAVFWQMRGVLFCAKSKCAVFYSVLRVNARCFFAYSYSRWEIRATSSWEKDEFVSPSEKDKICSLFDELRSPFFLENDTLLLLCLPAPVLRMEALLPASAIFPDSERHHSFRTATSSPTLLLLSTCCNIVGNKN